MSCEMCDGTAEGRLRQFQYIRSEATKYTNEHQKDTIIFLAPDRNYGFRTAEQFFEEKPGLLYEYITHDL